MIFNVLGNPVSFVLGFMDLDFGFAHEMKSVYQFCSSFLKMGRFRTQTLRTFMHQC